MKRKFGLYYIGCLITLLILGCSNGSNNRILVEKLNLPIDDYGKILYFPNGQLLLQAGRLSPQFPDVLRYYSLATNSYLDLPFRFDERCSRGVEYRLPIALPDSRLGLNQICKGRWQDQPIGQDNATYIIAYDFESEEFEQIVDEPLPFEAMSFTWNPNLTSGVQDFGVLNGTIFWLTRGGMEPIDLVISDGEKSWKLSDNLNTLNDDVEIGNLGIAERPNWSFDGKTIAFWASTDAIGKSGISRARAFYSLYLLDPNSMQLKEIVTNVQFTNDIFWSPDNSWLLFNGRINSSKEAIWIVSNDGQKLELVDSGENFRGWNWMDDQTIIAAKCIQRDCVEIEINSYDISQILNAFTRN